MSASASHGKIATYRELIGLGEGLSFSDYYTDDIPYDVRPVHNTTPMEEDDFPIQAKNLFKGLWEENDDSPIFIGEMKPEQKEEFKSALASLFTHLQKELKLKTIPSVTLLSDEINAKKLLGKTAYYDAEKQLVCLYIVDRHPKDILRSFSHEVVHHWQHENKQLDKAKKGEEHDPQYAQNDPWMRQMEKQAYLLGNILFRDWEDAKKAKDRKSNKKMVERMQLIGKQYPNKRPDYRT